MIAKEYILIDMRKILYINHYFSWKKEYENIKSYFNIIL